MWHRAIANAIYDAVRVRIRELPITAEKVLEALKAKSGTNEPSPIRVLAAMGQGVSDAI